MFLFNQQNLCKNWNCYFWRFQSFLWKYPPTQTKVWLSLIKICVVIGALRTTENRVKSSKPYMEKPISSNLSLVFCFATSQSGSGLCFAKPRRAQAEAAVDPRQMPEHASHPCSDSLDGFCGLQLLVFSKQFTRYRQWSVYQRLCSHS